MQLDHLLCSFFNLGANATANDLLNKLDQEYDNRLDGLLATEDSREKARRFISDLENYSLEVCKQITPATKAYSVTLDGCQQPTLVGLLGLDLRDAPPPPTTVENLAFWSLLDVTQTWHGTLFDDTAPVIPWRNVLAGHALLAWPKTLAHETQPKRMLAALFSLVHSDLPKTSMTTSVLSTTTSLSATIENENSVTRARLLSDAMTEVNPKWRFLSFYRIVEHAYLNNIKQILLREFARNAKAAVKKASDSLSSEPNQLVTLTESINLQAEFVSFNDSVDILIQNNNQFMMQVDKAAREESLYGAIEIYKKGIIRFYKLRCSIAHGGTSSVIFEEFADANDAAIDLMQKVEAIALKSMGIVL